MKRQLHSDSALKNIDRLKSYQPPAKKQKHWKYRNRVGSKADMLRKIYKVNINVTDPLTNTHQLPPTAPDDDDLSRSFSADLPENTEPKRKQDTTDHQAANSLKQVPLEDDPPQSPLNLCYLPTTQGCRQRYRGLITDDEMACLNAGQELNDLIPSPGAKRRGKRAKEGKQQQK